MITYLDKTFCTSKNCKNKCGRQLTKEISAGARRLKLPLSLGKFCETEIKK